MWPNSYSALEVLNVYFYMYIFQLSIFKEAYHISIKKKKVWAVSEREATAKKQWAELEDKSIAGGGWGQRENPELNILSSFTFIMCPNNLETTWS